MEQVIGSRKPVFKSLERFSGNMFSHLLTVTGKVLSSVISLYECGEVL